MGERKVNGGERRREEGKGEGKVAISKLWK